MKVPADVAVAGFDDIPSASFVNPPLTTIRQDTASAGTLLVDSLLKLIRGESAEPAILPIKLVVRKSSVR
jgi:DNA-binding LacI/PurR family transcriptional regulator